jgi:hypothetical protein
MSGARSVDRTSACGPAWTALERSSAQAAMTRRDVIREGKVETASLLIFLSLRDFLSGSQLARNAVATGSAAALIAGSNPPIAAIAIAQHRLTTTRCGVTAM